ncbi:hypothetical protein ACJMK2_009146 [Sinanodonta woodiana]|uniref:Uncharacterized protein n=1 Tax=Sinanodonta woodiana TaxID=1069815 RepID=A0ABD3VBE9_SINWO
MYMPIKLHPFQMEMKDPERRKKWISYISRTSPAKQKKSARRVLCKIDPNFEQQSTLSISNFQSGLDFDTAEKISMCQNHASPSDIHIDHLADLRLFFYSFSIDHFIPELTEFLRYWHPSIYMRRWRTSGASCSFLLALLCTCLLFLSSSALLTSCLTTWRQMGRSLAKLSHWLTSMLAVFMSLL